MCRVSFHVKCTGAKQSGREGRVGRGHVCNSDKASREGLTEEVTLSEGLKEMMY